MPGSLELEATPNGDYDVLKYTPPASEVSETTSGGTRLIRKSLRTSVALAIIPVRPMMATHLGLVRAAVFASRPTDPRVLD